MKRILLIFLIIAGGYILFTSIGSFSGKDNTTAEVSNKIDNIEFEISSAKLNIIPSNRKDLEATLEGKGKLSVNESGDTIKVTHEQKWYEWLPFFSTSIVTVYIPEDYGKDMGINLSSGTVNFASLEANQAFKLENLTIDMSSGDVNLQNLDVIDFKHHGSSGNLSIDSLASKTSSIDISSGNVKIADFTGELEADISSGELVVQMKELTDEVDIDVSSGSVQLDLPDKADFVLKGDIGSGDLSYNYPLTIEKEDNHNIRARHGAGKHKIDIDVSSGSVKIF